MRIESEGFVEVQPTYQHVGYVSAAVNHNVLNQQAPPAGVFFGLALMSIVLAMMVQRKIGRSHGHPLSSVLAFAGLGLFVLGWARMHPGVVLHWRTELTPEFATTMYQMERLCAETEAWAAEHGRLPTADEWNAVHRNAEDCDGWGVPFEYRRWSEPSPFDDQCYEISMSSAQAKRIGSGYKKPICSYHLGPDGLFGTDDDRRGHPALGSIEFHRADLSQFRHGRTPRKPRPRS